MARPRTFEPEAALDDALRLFWTQGYDGTSLDDLVKATGLNRSSLYSTFGSKHALFVATLERYVGEVGSALTACAAQTLPTMELLDRLMTRGLMLTSVEGKSRGCFLGNTSLALAGRDPIVRQRVLTGLRAVESIFAEVVRRGVKSGELPQSVDPARAGQFLTSSFQGMLVMSKAGASRAELTSLQKATLSILTQEMPP